MQIRQIASTLRLHRPTRLRGLLFELEVSMTSGRNRSKLSYGGVHINAVKDY